MPGARTKLPWIGALAVLASGLPLSARAEVHYLELIVNQRAEGRIVAVNVEQGRYAVSAGDLRREGVAVEPAMEEWVWLDSLQNVSVRYDEALLRLLIDVPPAWLPAQRVGREHSRARSEAQGSTGLLLNYDLFGRKRESGDTSMSTWTELRIFGGSGVFSTTGMDRRDSAAPREGFVRHDTRWTVTDQRRLLTWEVGDLVTRGSAWSGVARLGGLQLSRDFAVRPDVVTYPLPQFEGEAAVPTTVDLFINGFRADSAAVQPGPFTLSSVPFINGAGDAVITYTDALGRQTTTAMPFYVSSELLAPGLTDFAVAAGALRQGYGRESFDYGSAAASAAWRRGLSNQLTLEARADATSGFVSGGTGAVLRLGLAGVLSASWSQSSAGREQGRELQLGYRYSAPRFGISAQHTRRSARYADLGSYGWGGSSTGQSSTSVTGSLQLGAMGSFGAAYFDVASRMGERTRLANFSWSLSAGNAVSVHASANRELDAGRWSGSLQFVAALGRRRGSISGAIQQREGREALGSAAVHRTAPVHGGLGWSMGLAQQERGGAEAQADLMWRSRVAEWHAGARRREGVGEHWAGGRGSWVFMGGAAFAAARVHDGFVVVSTGQGGVPVHFENQFVGTTDARGHLLVPWVTPFHEARYAIDPLGLPVDVETPLVEQRVAVRRGAGLWLAFPLRPTRSLGVTLRDTAGEPLPVGTLLHLDGDRTVHVGWDGFAYLESPGQFLRAVRPDGRECSVDAGELMVAVSGRELTCH